MSANDGYHKVFTLTVPALSANSISLSQTPSGAGNLTITGSLATGGVATLSPPQRVGVTSSGNLSALTFTVTGTGINGLAQSEAIAGPNNATVHTVHNFATVTQIAIDGAAGSALTAGTVGIASTSPLIVDRWVNPAEYTAAVVITGAANCTLEASYDDFSPAWDLNANTPTWFSLPGLSNLVANAAGPVTGPITMVRLTSNSGTGTSTATFITPYRAA